MVEGPWFPVGQKYFGPVAKLAWCLSRDRAVSSEAIAVVAGLVAVYGLVSARLDRAWISGPLVFTVAGLALGPSGLGVVAGRFEEGAVEVLAEATLVVLLFADATRIDLRLLGKQYALPARMLGIGLPLTVVLGTALIWLVLDISVWEAALIAAVLSPTDAALGQAVVGDPRVPVRIRQGLNVESGLNDGLMVPVITVLIAVAAADAGLEAGEAGAGGGPSTWVGFAAQQIGFGLVCGVVVGGVGGCLLDRLVLRGWVEGAMRQLVTLAFAVCAFAGAEVVGGNGFVAAFVAGMTFGFVAGERCEDAADFTEDEGQLLALLTFLFYGALLLGPRLEHLTVEVALCAVGALTVMRAVPAAVSLVGAGLKLPTVAYLGWFGPRGLASIVFGLVAVEELGTERGELILDVVVWTVAASIVAHGLSAPPMARLYGQWFEGQQAHSAMPEAQSVDEMRPRLPM